MSNIQQIKPGPGARVVVFGGPRDGAGRTSLVANLAVALSRGSLRVGVLDMDVGAHDLSVWLARRRARLAQEPDLVMPAGLVSAPRWTQDRVNAERDELARWDATLAAMSAACDVLLIDAPSGGGSLVRRIHESADVVVTLVTQGDAGFDSLFEPGEDGLATARPSSYVRSVWEARRRRGARSTPAFAWRLTPTRGLDRDAPAHRLRAEQAERLVGASSGPVMSERACVRRGLDAGLTVFDAPPVEGSDETPDYESYCAELRMLAIVLQLSGLEGAPIGF